MKRSLTAVLFGAMLLPVQAQWLSRDSFGGAVLGGIIGGVIGHNSGRRSAEGAAIGAGAGLLLGALSHNSRRDYCYPGQGVLISRPAYFYDYESRPNYAITGTVLGGIAGGVIGHNSGRRTAEGIAIGAGAGLIFGAVADQNVRQQYPFAETTPAYVTTAAPGPSEAVSAAAPALQQPSVINTAYSSSGAMSGANALFGR